MIIVRAKYKGDADSKYQVGEKYFLDFRVELGQIRITINNFYNEKIYKSLADYLKDWEVLSGNKLSLIDKYKYRMSSNCEKLLEHMVLEDVSFIKRFHRKSGNNVWYKYYWRSNAVNDDGWHKVNEKQYGHSAKALTKRNILIERKVDSKVETNVYWIYSLNKDMFE